MEYINDELIVYLNKLIKTIETQSTLEFGNIKIIDQTRVDDILCCIDINFPEILKKYQKAYGKDRNVKSFDLYQKLINNIKIKPPLTKSKYAVNYSEAFELVKLLKYYFVQDVTYVCKTYPDLLNKD
mgnify:CR=1 FL=1